MTVSPETLEKILQAQRFQGGAWQKVIDCGRQYAMMAATCSYMESDRRLSVGANDRKSYEDMFAKNLLTAARDAFIEDAMVGAEIQSAKETT
jgi:hypothetical protein